MRRAFPVLLLVCAWALAPGGPAEADKKTTAQDVVDCMASNVPDVDDVRSLRLITKSPAGHERVTRVDAYGRRGRDGERRLLLRFAEPAELEGASFLIVERNGSNEFFLHSPALGAQRQIESTELGSSLFGTDFSYEDIVRFQGLLDWTGAKRLDDVTVAGRDAYVVENRPQASAYSRIVTAVDQERCVVLESKMYERSEVPRKIFTTDPDLTLFVNAQWIPQSLQLRDLRDGSQTNVSLRSVVTSLQIPDELFQPNALGRVKPRLELEPGRPEPRIEVELIEPEVPQS